MTDIAILKQHPDYSHGYFDGLDGLARREGMSAAYDAGFTGGSNAKRLFAEAGFSQKGHRFSKRMIIRGHALP